MGGLAIILKREIKYQLLPPLNLSGGEILLIRVSCGLDLVLGAAYVAPKARDPFTFTSLSPVFAQYNRVLIGGDFNARHTDWGNPSSNQRGMRLMRFAQNDNIVVVSSDTYSFHLPGKRPTNLDIFLMQGIRQNLRCYTVVSLSSLHLPVFLDILHSFYINQTYTYTTDWNKFNKFTSSWKITNSLNTIESIDYCIDNLTKFIINSSKSSTTKTKKNFSLNL